MGKLTNNYKIILSEIAKSYLSNAYPTFAIAGRPQSWNDDEVPPTVSGTPSEIAELRRDFLVGVKITPSDVASIIARNTWATGTVYAQYDPEINLEDQQFFVINSARDVFKCIYNNDSAESTVEPSSQSLSPFELVDGYVWKYMFTVDEASDNKFGSPDYIPITANSAVLAGSIKGTIDAYKVVSSDINYYKAELGSINEVVSSTMFKLANSANTDANTLHNSAMYITSGTGAGSLATIASSHANALGKYVQTVSSLSLDLTSSYMITPRVEIVGDGVGAKAVSFVTNNTITSIKSINSGNNYTYANVEVYVSPIFSSGCVVKPLISPLNGHGSNSQIELLSTKISVNVDFEPDVDEDLPIDLDYRQMAVLIGARNTSNVYVANSVISYVTTLDVDAEFVAGDKIVGANSAAMGYVYHANSSVVKLHGVVGSFANGEVVSSASSNTTANVSSVTARESDKNSGQVVYYTNFIPINRSNTTSESLSLVIDFQG